MSIADIPTESIGTIPRVDTPEEVCERVLEAASFIPLSQLGATDDCVFSPFSDDTSTSRESAFAKIKARVQGTRMAARKLGSRDELEINSR